MTEALTPDSLRPGCLVGPWRITGYAGRGANGAVFRARRAGHPGSPLVALKLALFPRDPRFEREGTLLSRFHHPAMPGWLDQGGWRTSTGTVYPYLVMEWIRGVTLYAWAREYNPSQRQVLQVVAQLAWGLEVLHRARCLHRDVRGDNIMVEPEGRAVLMDFGCGTWAGAPPLTGRVLAPGTREYRSPEALRSEREHWHDKDARYEARPTDDLYALGVSAYRLVTGGYPPPGTDPEELKELLGAPTFPRLPVQTLNERMVPELSSLIERMLVKEPEARGYAREVAEAADLAAERLGTKVDVPLSAQEAPTAASRHPEVEVISVRARAEPLPRSLASRLVLTAAALALAIVGLCPNPDGHMEPSGPTQAEAPNVEEAPDAGTIGLGDGGITARVAIHEMPISPEAVAKEMPKQPLSGQRRAPCRRGEIEIHGGCWIPWWVTSSPPCGDEAYDWKGTCYYPIPARARVPTSKKSRE